MLDLRESRPVGIRMATGDSCTGTTIPAMAAPSKTARACAARLAGKRVLHLPGRRRRRQDDDLRGARARAGAGGAEGRGRHDRSGQAPGLGARARASSPASRSGIASTRRCSPSRASTMKGELWAMMLDAKRTFDEIVTRLAPDERAREEILANPIYRELSTAVAGSQELSAIAKLYELLRGARLRRDRARHAALAQRARLPRRARRACSASSKAARCRCSSRPAASPRACSGAGTGARVRDLRARHRRRHAQRAVDASSARCRA